MSVNLKTNCKNCVHEKVCKNHGKKEHDRIMDILEKRETMRNE